VVSVETDLRLNDGYQTIVLSNSGITSECVSRLVKRELSRTIDVSVNLDDTSPLTEADTTRIVILAAFSKSIKTLSSSLFTRGSSDDSETLIDIHSNNNSTVIEDLFEAHAIVSSSLY